MSAHEPSASPEGQWWREAVIYHIYMRSFQDSNGDGIGDLQGVIDRLGHLGPDGLGIDAIWLSPVYPSPNRDFGYDVSDYGDIHPDFGTLADLDRLIAEAGKRGIRVLLDFVPNHTSTDHAWFRDHPEFYVWQQPGRDGELPNNWPSTFGGPAWEWDETRAAYYLHEFLVEQADVEWRNPGLRAAMLDAMRFWLGRGVAGFRLDVVDRLMKDPEFRDNPVRPNIDVRLAEQFPVIGLEPKFTENTPDNIEALRAIRAMAEEFSDGTLGERVLIGECFPESAEALARYYGSPDAPGLHLSFNFKRSLADVNWSASAFHNMIDLQARELPAFAWPCTALSNHDRSRAISRHDPSGDHPGRAAALAAVLLTTRGTPVIYYGEEIGMRDVPVDHDDSLDPVEAAFPGMGRDPERSPMRWDSSSNGGFTTGSPWLRIGDDLESCNVAVQLADPGSTLNAYRHLLRLRRERASLRLGAQQLLSSDDGVLAYVRTHDGEGTAVAVNFGNDAVAVPAEISSGTPLFGQLDDDGLLGADGVIIAETATRD